MPLNSQKLDRFLYQILEDAQLESQTIEARNEARRKAYLENAENEILAEVFNYIRSKASTIRNESGRAISRKILENKHALFQTRQKIKDDVLGEVRDRVIQFTETPDYAHALSEMVRSARKKLGDGPLQVTLRKADLHYVHQLLREQADGFAQITFSEGTFTLGGLVAESTEKNLLCDWTYDAALDEITDHFSEITGFGS